MGTRGADQNKRVVKTCRNCGAEFSVPQCRDWREHCCSSACKKELRAKVIAKRKSDRMRICGTCGKEFEARQWLIDQGFGKYCSNKCATTGNVGSKRSPETIIKMSMAQKNSDRKWLSGPDSPMWKKSGISDGYRWIWVDGKKVFEHRYVVELHIGRKLSSDEIVHHINEDKLDNRIENLMICSRVEHMNIHIHSS